MRKETESTIDNSSVSVGKSRNCYECDAHKNTNCRYDKINALYMFLTEFASFTDIALITK